MTKQIKKTTTNKRFTPKSLATSLTLISLASLTLSGCSNMNIDSSDDKIQQAVVPTVDNTITLAQVTQDVTYLASDALQGRSNFHP